MKTVFLLLILGAVAAGEAKPPPPAAPPPADTLDAEKARKAAEALERIGKDLDAGQPVTPPAEEHLKALATAEKHLADAQAHIHLGDAVASGKSFMAGCAALEAIPREARPGLDPRYKKVRADYDALALRLLGDKGLAPKPGLEEPLQSDPPKDAPPLPPPAPEAPKAPPAG